MEIGRVVGDLVVTRRAPGMMNFSLRIIEDKQGKLNVACDPIGVPPGKWVFTCGGSAARIASGNYKTVTDMTILGIMDNWVVSDSK